jgi:hypothetical protein
MELSSVTSISTLNATGNKNNKDEPLQLDRLLWQLETDAHDPFG